MQTIDALTTQLCDHLMDAAKTGDLEVVGSNVTLVIEYAAYELARAGNSDLSVSVFAAANELERRFRTAMVRRQEHQSVVLAFKPSA